MVKFVIMLTDIKKSILSGIMISIGGTAYLSCIAKGYTWLGAILFAAGLFTICEYSYNLYTGKVGYIAFDFKNTKYVKLVILTLVFNLLSTFFIGLLLKNVFNCTKIEAEKLYSIKLSTPYWKSFVSAIFCGILMYLSVDTWKRGSKIGCFVYIPAFILSGFDHSIANSFYNGLAFGENTFTLRNIIFVIVVILGNAVGGMIVPLLSKNKDDNKNI